MTKQCYLCGELLKEGQLVEITVIARFHEIPSKRSYSIDKPVDAYADTLRHNICPNGSSDDYTV